MFNDVIKTLKNLEVRKVCQYVQWNFLNMFLKLGIGNIWMQRGWQSNFKKFHSKYYRIEFSNFSRCVQFKISICLCLDALNVHLCVNVGNSIFRTLYVTVKIQRNEQLVKMQKLKIKKNVPRIFVVYIVFIILYRQTKQYTNSSIKNINI